jgi:tRNA threonylcarbamoyladenosine biosynthesis protein TsaE
MTEIARGTRTTSRPLTQAELEHWGRAVGRAALTRGGTPLVLALRGALGSGKSVLARAVARGLGVDGTMPSPTYNLVLTYAGSNQVAVHHLDLYRLEAPDDVWELGWEELGDGAVVALIEWPERAEALLPADRWDVFLEFSSADHPEADVLRRVRIVPRGQVTTLPPIPPAAPTGNGPAVGDVSREGDGLADEFGPVDGGSP